jgi:hypothetical protein
MKKMCKHFGMIALIAIVVFAFAGCPGGDDTYAPATNGRLIINGLDSIYNGKYASAAAAYDNLPDLDIAEDYNLTKNTITGGLVSDGSVTLNVWLDLGNEELSAYSGNGTYVVTVSFYESETIPRISFTREIRVLSDVEFIAGEATVNLVMP